MTGIELVHMSLSLLGYSENDGNLQLTQKVLNSALPITNLVYNDVRRILEKEFAPIKSLSDELDIDEKAMDVMACGVASYIALKEGDDLMQSVWSSEYQTRRTTLSKVTEVEDVLPVAH